MANTKLGIANPAKQRKHIAENYKSKIKKQAKS